MVHKNQEMVQYHVKNKNNEQQHGDILDEQIKQGSWYVDILMVIDGTGPHGGMMPGRKIISNGQKMTEWFSKFS